MWVGLVWTGPGDPPGIPSVNGIDRMVAEDLKRQDAAASLRAIREEERRTGRKRLVCDERDAAQGIRCDGEAVPEASIKGTVRATLGLLRTSLHADDLEILRVGLEARAVYQTPEAALARIMLDILDEGA